MEESISEYSSQVNQFNIRENLLHLRGQVLRMTSHIKSFTKFWWDDTLSEQYGTEVGVGGSVDMKSGSIQVVSGSQTYDLQTFGVQLVKVTKEWKSVGCIMAQKL